MRRTINKFIFAGIIVLFLGNSCVKKATNPSAPIPPGLTVYINDTLLMNDTNIVAHFGNDEMLFNDSLAPDKGFFVLISEFNAIESDQYLQSLVVFEPKGNGRADYINYTHIFGDDRHRFTISGINYINHTISGDFNIWVNNGWQSQLVTGTFRNIRYDITPSSSPSNQFTALVNNTQVGKLESAFWDNGHTKLIADFNNGSTIWLYLDPNTAPGSYQFSPTTYLVSYISPSGKSYLASKGTLTVTGNTSKTISASFNFTGFVNTYNPVDSINVTSGSFSVGK